MQELVHGGTDYLLRLFTILTQALGKLTDNHIVQGFSYSAIAEF